MRFTCVYGKVTILLFLCVLMGTACNAASNRGITLPTPLPSASTPIIGTGEPTLAEPVPTEPGESTQSSTVEPGLSPTSPPAPERNLIIREAAVESVDILIAESYPVQVRVIARGYLPDGCTEISHSTQSVMGDVISVRLFTKRPAELMCTQALVPYEHTILLDLSALSDGRYVVDVNGVRANLDLRGSGK